MMTQYHREYAITRPQLLGMITRFCFGGLVTIDFGNGVLFVHREAITWSNHNFWSTEPT